MQILGIILSSHCAFEIVKFIRIMYILNMMKISTVKYHITPRIWIKF